MSESAPHLTPAAPPQPLSGRTWLKILGGLFAVVILIVGGPLEQLLFGWLYFPFRVLPQVTVDWPSVILGLVSTILFCAGLHVTIRWFLDQTSRQPWSVRSTIVIAASLVLMFAAGTAMVGATHQALWLAFGKAGEVQPVRATGILGGGVFGAREAARRTLVRSELKQFGLACHNLDDIYGQVPPGGTMTKEGELLHGWVAIIGPYYTLGTHVIDFAVPWNKSPNDRYYRCGISSLIIPGADGPYFDDDGYGLNHFSANVRVLPLSSIPLSNLVVDDLGRAGLDSQFRGRQPQIRLADITDGTSNTLLIGTIGAGFKPWGHPANLRDPAAGINRGPQSFGGPPHWQGAMFLMCDGSVRMLNEATDPQVLKALATPDGGETVPAK